MKTYKKLMGLTVALGLLFQTTGLASVTIPPIPADMVNQTQNGGPAGQGTDGTAAGGPGNGTTQGGTLSYTTATTVPGDSLEVPTVKSAAAVLYDATHNQFLFEKDADTQYYPASITKLMTALLVLENCQLEDTVTFNSSAVTGLESGSVSLNITTGDKLSVKDSLYGLLLKSANEVANGLAEHVSGSIPAFADKMNEKAKALGAVNTHFANPNGLNNSNHVTTARDMALIAKAAFENKTLCQIASTLSYQFPATKLAASPRTITMGHKMLYPTDSRYYSGIVGGKTGYTSLAGNTLVTCVERDGVRLIVVILKSKQTHYEDTKALLDYGFAKAAASGSQPVGSGGPGSGGSVSSSGNQWIKDSAGWRFSKADGSAAQNECILIDGQKYWFDANGYMAIGWQQIGGKWHYFNSTGAMAKNCWVETEGYWYCLDPEGNLYTNTTTPDGFPVDTNGIWIR